MPEGNNRSNRRDIRPERLNNRSSVEVDQPKGKFKDHFQEMSEKVEQAKNQKQGNSQQSRPEE